MILAPASSVVAFVAVRSRRFIPTAKAGRGAGVVAVRAIAIDVEDLVVVILMFLVMAVLLWLLALLG